MRKLIAIALGAAIQIGALASPLVHVHPDDHDTDHHVAGAVHAHWAGHAAPAHSDFLSLDSEDHDRAVFLNVFVAESRSGLAVPGLTPATFVVPVPAERAAHRSVEVLHSHDPPPVTPPSSRAPPSFLS